MKARDESEIRFRTLYQTLYTTSTRSAEGWSLRGRSLHSLVAPLSGEEGRKGGEGRRYAPLEHACKQIDFRSPL